MATVPKLHTLEEFLELPEAKPALEFEEGQVIQKVSPKAKHSVIQYALAALINAFAQPLKLAFAFPELRATFGGRSYVPDVSVYRWNRIPLDDRGEPVDDVFIPPDLAIEIVSPKQSVTRVARRCSWYVANGVRIALLVDPGNHSAVRFLPDQPPHPLDPADPIGFGDLLPGFNITVERLFASLNFR